MPRLDEETNVTIPITSEPVTPQSTRLPPIVSSTDLKEEEVKITTRLPPEEEPVLTIADFKENPEVQNRAYSAINYLYNNKYDDKTKAVDKYIDLARQADFNLTSAGMQYRDFLKKQKRTDPESKQYIEDISWLYNEFYEKNSETGKDKYKIKGMQRLGLTGDILQGAVTDLTNWATVLAFPWTGGQSATARVAAGETAKQGLRQAMKNAVSKTYKVIPKVPIDPRSFKQVGFLTTTEGFVIGSTDNYLRQKRFNELGVEGYEDFSTTEMLKSGAFGATIGLTVGGATNLGYRFFDARALRQKQDADSKDFENVILDNFDRTEKDVEIILPNQAKATDDVEIVIDNTTQPEPRPDVEIITLEIIFPNLVT